jgi:sec-independent protein translocase protein TatC
VINLTEKIKKKVINPKNTKIKNPSRTETGKSVIKKNPDGKMILSKKNNSSVPESKKSNAAKMTGDSNEEKKQQKSKIKNLPEKIDIDQVDPLALERGDQPMTIVEHLTELRTRLISLLVSFFVLACIAFFFSDELVHFINKPFLETGNRLNVFTVAGGFMIKMKVSVVISLIVLIPFIVFHIWRFISPAIEKPERLFSRVTIFFAVLLFYSGVIFVFILLPSMIKVLLGFIDTSMLSTIGADDYLHFIFFMSFIMGFLCELPIIILILTKVGLVTPQFLIRKRKYAVIIIWVTAAMVTPGPDILSQSLVGVPLMLLYEVSIVISKLTLIRRKRKELKLRYR